MKLLGRLLRDSSGASAVEFVILTPVLLIFIFGAIDVGGYAWALNQGAKATQAGARLAVVTDPVDSGLAGADFVGQSVTVGGVTTTLAQGDLIPAQALGLITCDSSGCTCTTAPCPGTRGFTSAAYQRIKDRMVALYPQVGDTGNQVIVEYRGSGLGYAGDPDGMDIVPFVTVRVTGMTYKPFSGLAMGVGSIGLPDFRYSLTAEDSSGSLSN